MFRKFIVYLLIVKTLYNLKNEVISSEERLKLSLSLTPRSVSLEITTKKGRKCLDSVRDSVYILQAV